MSSVGVAASTATGLPRLFAGLRKDRLPLWLDGHAATHGPLPSARGLIELVTASGLRGRGGGGFPAGRKLAASPPAGAGRSWSQTGRKASRSASRTSSCCAARRTSSWMARRLRPRRSGRETSSWRSKAPRGEEIGIVSRALDERRDRGLEWQLAVVAPGFVTGEETALVSALEGRNPKPTATPPRPFERGYRGAPTLVQNVETLAHMALIARHGHDWFRALGTRDEPGSGLFTVSGAVGRPGVYEAAFGSPLRALVAQAGGVRGEPGAFLVGGFFGSWIEPFTAQRLSLLDSELAQAGAGLGAGAIAVLPAAACGLDQSARVARYLADESAGQCGPCVHGLARARRCARGPRRRSRRQPRRTRCAGCSRSQAGAHAGTRTAPFASSRARSKSLPDEVELHLRGHCSGRRGEFLPTTRSNA